MFLEDEDFRGRAAQLAKQALDETQERFGGMFELMPLCSLVHTDQGILYAIAVACALLRRTSAECVGAHILDFVTVAHAEISDAIAHALGGQASDEPIEAVVSVAGAERHMNLIASPVPWAGTPVAMLLLQDIIELKHKEEALRRMATIDELTVACNRRHLFQSAEAFLRTAPDMARLTSIVMFDIDHFKKVNDTYGHAAGDEAVKSAVRVAEGFRRRKKSAFSQELEAGSLFSCSHSRKWRLLCSLPRCLESGSRSWC